MSSSRISTFAESESLLLNAFKQIHNEYEHREISIEKIQLLSEKLYRIWTRSRTVTPSINGNNEGFLIVDYLERLLSTEKMNDTLFILAINTLVRNQNFYHSFLMDHKRFKQVFNLSLPKSVHLARYIELLYYYCPLNLISNVALEFYRFVVDAYFIKCLKQMPLDIEWLAAFSALLYQFNENSLKYLSSKEYIFVNQCDAISYSTCVINTLMNHHLRTTIAKDLNHDLKLINRIIKTTDNVWKQSLVADCSTLDKKTSVQVRSLEYLFGAISTRNFSNKSLSANLDKSNSTIGASILSLFSLVQLDIADTTLKAMFNDGRLNGERFSTMIKCLLELIDAPILLIQNMPYDTWILGLCTALVTFQQHEHLKKVIDDTTAFLIDHLFYSHTYDNAVQILFWFVRYDKRIQTFQRLLARLPELFEHLKQNNNDDLKMRLIELCHMALAIHPDSGLSNELILKEIFRPFPQPDLNVLLNHKHMHARLHSMAFENENLIKARVGIVNLGNTCYVNSVIQALYQCDLFRKYILERHFNDQIVLRELQIIFAQLNLSKRPYITVQISRPAWFTVNEQQDCAEFLGYLLDIIKDEEKKDRRSLASSLGEIERLFTIRTCQINRCEGCSNETYREEASNYLFLPMPTVNNQSDNFNNNQSPMSVSLMHNGLKFYAAANENSTTDDQAKSVAASFVQRSTVKQNSLASLSSNTSVRSRSPSTRSRSLPNKADNSSNLQSVFDAYFQKEELKGENQYRCERCRSLQNAERYTILQAAPEFLILSLNRFEYDKKTNVFRKVFTKINYPKVLNVSIRQTRNSPLLAKYCLVLVIVHTGYTLHGGHYYIYAREVEPSSSKHNRDEQEDYFSSDEWFLINDDVVQVSSYEAMIENCAQYTSATPYVLFYKRIDRKRIDAMEKTKQINVQRSLIERINEDNVIYERDLERRSVE